MKASRPERAVYLVLLIVLVSMTLYGRGWGMRHARHHPDAAAPLGVMPGEFESQEAVLLSWPLNVRPTRSFDPARVNRVDQVWCDIIDALRGDVRILVLAARDSTREHVTRRLAEAQIPDEMIEFLPVPANYGWIRDYGPVCLRSPAGSHALIDADYYAERLINPHPQDDRAPRFLGQQLGLPVIHAPIAIQHGNLLSNGRGLCITTQHLVRENHARGYGEQDIARVLQEYYGAEEVLFLEPLDGEYTGHVDMFATFTSPDTVVVGQYSHETDPVNAAILDRNAERLANLELPDGPLRVVRIPMPRRPKSTSGAEVWLTYTNVVFGNSKLLVPTYSGLDPEAQSAAIAVYRSLLPDRKIVEIDALRLIECGGSLHCVTVNLASTQGGNSASIGESLSPAAR